MRVLMSLNNVGHFNSQFSLASVDTESGEMTLVDCSEFMDLQRDTGVTGLTPLSDGRLALAVQSAKPRIVLLDGAWNAVKSIRHEAFSDIHSMIERDGYLFVLSTGVNKVMKISLATHQVSLFWEYPGDAPFLHMNALAFDGERALVSSHKIPPEAEGGGVSGGCWYLDDYEVAFEGLSQPHSLTVEGRDLWCFSSHDGRVARRRPGKAVEYFPIDGYLRGLAFDGDRILVGVSSKRFVSRKKTGVVKYADFKEVIGNPLYMSGLAIADRKLRVKRRIDMTAAGFEIYDVIPHAGPPKRLQVADVAPIRMQTMQRLLISLRERLDKDYAPYVPANAA